MHMFIELIHILNIHAISKPDDNIRKDKNKWLIKVGHLIPWSKPAARKMVEISDQNPSRFLSSLIAIIHWKPKPLARTH